MNLVEKIDELGTADLGAGEFPDGYLSALDDVKELVQEYQDLVNKVIAKRVKLIGQARRDLSREVLGEAAAVGTLPEIVQKTIEEYRRVCAELSEAVDE